MIRKKSVVEENPFIGVIRLSEIKIYYNYYKKPQ